MSTISTGHAKKLIENYVKNKLGKTIDPSETTRAVWFSREDLLTALNNPVHGVMPNGLRFYFGAYEAYNPPHPPRYKEDANKITLVIIPTTGILDASGKITEHPYRLTPPEVYPFDLLDTPDAIPDYDEKFSSANDGQICPPPRTII